MGILTSQCCTTKNTEDINKSINSAIKKDSKINISNSGLQKDDSPNSNESNCSPKDYYNNLMSQPKRVLFSNFVNQRIFSDIFKVNEKKQMEEQYNDIEIYIKEKEEEVIATNISFEESNNRFLIEDCFYKIKYELPNTIEHIQSKFTTLEEKSNIKNLIKYAVLTCKNHVNNNIHRIDGILLINSNTQLVIITEQSIFDFYYDKDDNKYILNSEYRINYIDYMSLSSDYSMLILHFVPSIGKNFTIIHEALQNVAGCICSSNLCDRVGRKIPIILFNKAFEITPELIKCTKFDDYVNIMNSFLNDKLRLTFLSSDFDFFRYKYSSVRIKIHSKFTILDTEYGIIGDIVITNDDLYILKYLNSDFEIINKIVYKNLTKFSLCKDNNSFIISDDDSLGSYELISESYYSIFNLIKNFQ